MAIFVHRFKLVTIEKVSCRTALAEEKPITTGSTESTTLMQKRTERSNAGAGADHDDGCSIVDGQAKLLIGLNVDRHTRTKRCAVAEHRRTHAINLPEDRFEAILCTSVLCAGRVVGVITMQHRLPYRHTTVEGRLLSTIGFLVGAEVERARLETENLQLSDRPETRKLLDRAKSVLQRDFQLSEEEAYRRMQRESRQRRKAMREVAEAILLTEDIRRSQD